MGESRSGERSAGFKPGRAGSLRAAMCAHTAGQRRICWPADRAGPGTLGEAEGWCRALQGTGRPLDQSPELAADKPGLSTEGEAPHRGPGAPAGRAASSLRSLQARHPPGVSPAGAAPFAGAAAPPPTSRRPAPPQPLLSLLTSAALRTDGRAGRVRRRRGAQGRGRPGTDAPQRRQRPPRAAGRRSAAPSRGRPALHRGLAGGRGAAVDAAEKQKEARTRAVASQDHCRLTTPRRCSPNSARSRRRGTPPRARAPRVTSARPATENDAKYDQSK